jgi:uncharacterized RDD family membrane protein YckC
MAFDQSQGTPPPAYPPQPGFPPAPGYPGAYPPPPGYGPGPAFPGAVAPGAGLNPPTLTVGFEYGGYWIRSAANSVDIAAVYGLSLVCIITVVGIFALPFLWLGYFPFFWSRGQTPGQRICGLRLVNESNGMPIELGTAIIRFIVVIAEFIGCFFLIGILGFIWPAFEARKRAWHDMAAGTVLIHAQLYNRQ